MIEIDPVECPRCQNRAYGGLLFCGFCGLYLRDETRTVERVEFSRRIGYTLLDGVLALATLIVGWYVWLYNTAPRSQTPAKSLMDVYVINLETGRAIDTGETWIREVVVKGIGLNIALWVTAGVAWLLDVAWPLFDDNRQALHDKLLKQTVVYAPMGLPESMRYVPGAPRVYAVQGLSVPGFNDTPQRPQQSMLSLAEQLRTLRHLRDENIITEEEYERKRAELAGKL